jgi:hypothetical protein
MAKNNDSNNPEKTLLLVLSLISVGLLVAIVYVWYSALGSNKGGTKPGDFIKPEPATSQTAAPAEASPSTSTPTQEPKSISLAISSPAVEEVVSTSSVKVAGATSPNANITITGGKEDIISTADANGEFSDLVSLIEGQNNLVITVFDNSGTQTSQSVSVVYMP